MLAAETMRKRYEGTGWVAFDEASFRRLVEDVDDLYNAALALEGADREEMERLRGIGIKQISQIFGLPSNGENWENLVAIPP